MSEAKRASKAGRAIAEFEEYKSMGYGQAYRPSSESIETALSALRAQEQNEPQCRDCKHLGKAWACDNCTYDRELRDRTSYYEPKGADHE